MTMRRPRSVIGPRDGLSADDIASPSTTTSSIAAWYVAVIAALLLVAAGIYIIYLHQQRLELREAANQMSIGRDLLRDDRDELLQKVRERETEVSSMERQAVQVESRLATLQNQRSELGAEVARLTRDLARAEGQLRGDALDGDLSKERPKAGDKAGEQADRRLQETEALLNARNTEIERLEAALDETERLLAQSRDDLRRQETLVLDAGREGTALEEKVERARDELAEARQAFRRGQIIRGHNASLGEVKPYLAEVGPEYWQVIEDWLDEKLGRKMVIPDLSAIGWSYEGARLLISISGPSMVMLLYANREGEPISWTIAKAPSQPMSPGSRQQAGLNLIEWRDASHAFILAGGADNVVLQVVAAALQAQVDEVSSDSPVPSGRFIRPEFRPSPL